MTNTDTETREAPHEFDWHDPGEACRSAYDAFAAFWQKQGKNWGPWDLWRFAWRGALESRDVPKVWANALGGGWRPVESCPQYPDKTSFLAIAYFPERNYWTDPWSVFRDCDNGYVRWPHEQPPTHWLPIPSPKETNDE